MNRIMTFVLVMSIALVVTVGCSQATPEPAAAPESEMEGMAESSNMEDMDHNMDEEDMEEEGMDHSMDEEDMEEEGMDHSMDEEGMEEGGMEHGMEMHDAAHGGQVGMAMHATKSDTDFHLEIVSAAPGKYALYLSDNNREPVSPEGYEGAVALIKPDGSEIASMPFMVMGDHLMAEGGPTDEASQLDVRVTLDGPDLADTLEMEFTLLYDD